MIRHTTGEPGTGPRSQVWVTEPDRPGNGTVRSWTRTIAGQTYSFRLVMMPSGEIRWFVSAYNGYINPRFSCAWSPHRKWIFRPSADLTGDPQT